MKKEIKKELINLATKYSLKSGDPHLKVGAVLIEKYKHGIERCFSVCAEGYNHLPKSHKHLGYKDDNDKTRPEVIHAEAHALSYLMKNKTIGKDCELFVTTSPCLQCAKMIIQSGIKRIYFCNYYKDVYPIEFLERNKVKVEQIL